MGGLNISFLNDFPPRVMLYISIEVRILRSLYFKFKKIWKSQNLPMVLKESRNKYYYSKDLLVNVPYTSLVLVSTPNILWVLFLWNYFDILVKYGIIEDNNLAVFKRKQGKGVGKHWIHLSNVDFHFYSITTSNLGGVELKIYWDGYWWLSIFLLVF